MDNGEKLKVFISYSRKDSTAFADDLLLALEDRGFAPFLDRHDIMPGEPWEARLGGLIEQSDSVVFVISPESMTSDRCVWEVDKALGLSKRLLPVIYKAVPDAEIPAKLSNLQFVRFDTAPGMMRPLRELAEALRVDLDWIREHTRLAELQGLRQPMGRQSAGAGRLFRTKRIRSLRHGWECLGLGVRLLSSQLRECAEASPGLDDWMPGLACASVSRRFLEHPSRGAALRNPWQERER
jgi:hypothetical protein